MTEDPAPLVLRCEARPECLDRVHDLVARLWDTADGFSDDARIRFETAVAEVAANVVEHAGSGDRAVALVLRLARRDGRVVAALEDDGRPAEVDLGALRFPADDAESGRGLALARAAADELTYGRDGDRNRWWVAVHA